MEVLIKKIRNLRQYIVIKSLLFFFSKTVYDYCRWSKKAEWSDGDKKKAFIANDWPSYLKLYLKDKT